MSKSVLFRETKHPDSGTFGFLFRPMFFSEKNEEYIIPGFIWNNMPKIAVVIAIINFLLAFNTDDQFTQTNMVCGFLSLFAAIMIIFARQRYAAYIKKENILNGSRLRKE